MNRAFNGLPDHDKLAALWGDTGETWRLVLDILRMFRILARSYYTLPVDERSGIEPRNIRFDGFDSKAEARLPRRGPAPHRAATHVPRVACQRGL
jgi:hypothetical protein